MQLNLQLAKDGTEIFELVSKEKRYLLNSTYRPEVEAEKFAKQYADISEGSVLIVFGFGNGIFAKEIAKQCKNKAKLIFFEPCAEIAEYLSKRCSLEDVCKKEQYYLSISCKQRTEHVYPMEQFPELLRDLIRYRQGYTLHYCSLPKYEEIFPDIYTQFKEQINYCVGMVQANANTAKLIGHITVRNNIQNYAYVIESKCGDSFINLFPKDIPVIIVSAGPSLEKNAHLLKNIGKNALILCVDAALKYLQKEGIMPHMIVSIDPRKNLDVFNVDGITGIPIVGVCDMSNKVLRRMKDSDVIFVKTDNPIINRMYRLSDHTVDNSFSGGSVATFAYDLSCIWGFKRIVLIGQDLAMTDNQFYAGMEKINIESDNPGWIPVEDVFGGTVYTTKDYFYYLKWFEQNIVMRPDVEVIDATEGGAKIKGSTIMTLQEVIDRYCKNSYDIESIISNVPYAFTTPQKRIIKGWICESKMILKKLVEQLKEGIDLSNQADILSKKERELELKKNKKHIRNQDYYTMIDRKLTAINEYYNSLDESFLVGREIDATELDAYLELRSEKYYDEEGIRYDWMAKYFGFILRATESVLEIYDECNY